MMDLEPITREKKVGEKINELLSLNWIIEKPSEKLLLVVIVALAVWKVFDFLRTLF
jgi:hypothetical protein